MADDLDMGITSIARAAEQVAEWPPTTLDLVERQLIGLLHAIWKAQGKRKRIVTLANGGPYEPDDD
jgi:hypothetical protein